MTGDGPALTAEDQTGSEAADTARRGNLMTTTSGSTRCSRRENVRRGKGDAGGVVPQAGDVVGAEAEVAPEVVLVTSLTLHNSSLKCMELCHQSQ